MKKTTSIYLLIAAITLPAFGRLVTPPTVNPAFSNTLPTSTTTRPATTPTAVPPSSQPQYVTQGDLARLTDPGRVGIWLYHTNGTRDFFTNNLGGAYTNEVSTDLLFIDNGIYVVPPSLTIKKEVHWKGQALGDWNWEKSRIVGGAILTNSLRVAFSNCTFDTFGVEAGDMVVSSSIQATNPANNVYRNLIVGDVTHAGAHNMYITGSGNLIDRVQCLNGGNHGILTIGCRNTIVRDCVSLGNQANSFVVKADPGQYGNVANITYEDCHGDGAILVQCVTNVSTPGMTGTLMSNVLIKNMTLNNSLGHVSSSVGGIWMEVGAGGCLIKDFCVEGLTVTGYSPTDHRILGTIYPHGGQFSNIRFKNSSVLNPYRNDCTTLDFAANPPDTTQIHCESCDVNGQIVNSVGFAKKVTMFFTTPTSYFGSSSGIAIPPDTILTESATNGLLYFTTTNFAVNFSLIQRGDPVWVTNGLAAGVYKYWSNGVFGVGQTVPLNAAMGFTNGNSFIQLTFAGTNGVYSPPSQWLPGNVMSALPWSVQYVSLLAEITVAAQGLVSDASQARIVDRFVSGGTSVPTLQSEQFISSYVMNIGITAHGWSTPTAAYIGIFGTPQSYWWVNNFQAGWVWPQMEVNIRAGAGDFVLMATNGWQ